MQNQQDAQLINQVVNQVHNQLCGQRQFLRLNQLRSHPIIHHDNLQPILRDNQVANLVGSLRHIRPGNLLPFQRCNQQHNHRLIRQPNHLLNLVASLAANLVTNQRSCQQVNQLDSLQVSQVLYQVVNHLVIHLVYQLLSPVDVPLTFPPVSQHHSLLDRRRHSQVGFLHVSHQAHRVLNHLQCRV